MTIETVNGWDATGANLHLVPPGEGKWGGGYLTGLDGVAWSAAQMAEFPDAVMYDQAPKNTPFNTTCDAFDMETNAVTIADLVPGLNAARANYNAGVRPGQRWPAVYASWDSKTQVVNDLINGGITACPLILADYDFTLDNAINQVSEATGPFPVIGFQYSNKGGGGAYDLTVFSLSWLNARSKKMGTPTTPTDPTPQSFVIAGVPGKWRLGTPLLVMGLGPEGKDLYIMTTTDGKAFTQTQQITV
jgi:hypothetical protein